jgi:hypothetical protein
MNFRHLLFFFIIIPLLTGCKTTDDKTVKNGPKNYQGATFTLKYPEGVDAAFEQGDGYATHYFRIGNSKAMLGLYEGMRPRLFSKDSKDLTAGMTFGALIRTRLFGERVCGAVFATSPTSKARKFNYPR